METQTIWIIFGAIVVVGAGALIWTKGWLGKETEDKIKDKRDDWLDRN